MKSFFEIAEAFGVALDKDDFQTAENLIHPDCIYDIVSSQIHGPKTIVSSYEENMIEGRKKMDELVWGKSYVKALGEYQFEVYFTDYLKHKGISHIHKCKQKLTLNEEGMIIKIEHINLAIGFWLLAFGFWLLAIGYWLLAIG